MSHKNVNTTEVNTEVNTRDLSYELDNGIVNANRQETDTAIIEDKETDSFDGLEIRVEKLKNDVKNLKKVKKQQEKLGKLEEKKTEILSEIEKEQSREKRSKDRHDKRKRK